MRAAGAGTSERGQATVEFAIVLPLVLLLIVGLIEFGKAFNYWLNLSHLANETARWAAVDTIPGSSGNPANTTPSVDDIKGYLVSQIDSQELQDSVNADLPNTVKVCFEPADGSSTTPAVGDSATVRVTVPYGLPLVSSVSSFANSLFGGSSTFGTINLTGSSTVRLEQVPEGTGWTACP